MVSKALGVMEHAAPMECGQCGRSDASPSLDDLPPDLLLHVLKLCTAPSQSACGFVSKGIRKQVKKVRLKRSKKRVRPKKRVRKEKRLAGVCFASREEFLAYASDGHIAEAKGACRHWRCIWRDLRLDSVAGRAAKCQACDVCQHDSGWQVAALSEINISISERASPDRSVRDA